MGPVSDRPEIENQQFTQEQILNIKNANAVK